MDYKKIYTKEELTELREWFEERLETLPKSYRFDAATFYPDLHTAVGYIIDITRGDEEKVAFSGQFHKYFVLREKLINDGY